ncbi:MAG: RidA family protein [Candidatus Latescibacterota bacterium]|nr:RidA family protein [Candidatus Latescibacterota bacterium]
MLIANPRGNYHFLKGIDPYSSGVIANSGYEIVFVTLRESRIWKEGFDAIGQHLSEVSQERSALCGVQLRCPQPYSIQGFIDFNRDYCKVLEDWNLFLGDLNPVARTNVAPVYAPPSQPELFAFAYTQPVRTERADPTLVIAGGGELRDGVLSEKSIIRRGDTSPEAMREKADFVMKLMESRLDGLGAGWDLLNQINLYTAYPIDDFAKDVILTRLGPARRMGVHWHDTRPPIVDIDFEMDMRGVRQELVL